jgi:hypothetical protein
MVFAQQEDELIERSAELLENNAPQVLQLLSGYAQSSGEYNLPLLMRYT